MPRKKARKREPLSRDRVLRAAMAIADQHGIEALSMRRLGQELGVEAMSLYTHVTNKDDLLNGIVDLAVAEVELPVPGEKDWKASMRRRSVSTYEMLLRHPWASKAIESQMAPGDVRLRYFDAVLGTLREAGFPLEKTFHVTLLLDGYIYGFVLQEQSWTWERDDMPDVIEEMTPMVPLDKFPYLAEVMAYAGSEAATKGEAPGFRAEFEFGLDLVLDGLDDALQRWRAS